MKQINQQLVLEGISKKFAGNTAIENISFSLAPGEIVALLGDNGAGKSSLIKIISGFHPPTEGKIFWEGKEISLAKYSPQKAREIGIQTVYQNLGLVEELSLTRNFFLGVELCRQWGPFSWLNHRLMKDIVRQELSQLGLNRQLDPEMKVAFLSGGERQVLAIARARYFGAKLLIMDEPTSALSLKQTQEVLNYLQQARTQGISIIYITHTLHHIQEIVDRVMILYQGHLIRDFPKGELEVMEWGQLIMNGSLQQHFLPPPIQ